MTTEPIDPRRSALLLMDFQTDVVGLVDDGDALLERVAGVRAACRARGVPTIYIRVALTDADRRAIPARNKSFSAVATSDRMADGSPGVEIDHRVRPEPDDLVFTKTRVGAFSTTNLAEALAARAIDTLVLTGIATSGVVLSTVRDAADLDYRLIVLADCCADANPLVHEVLIERVFPRQADVIAAADLERVFAGARLE